MTNLAEIRTRVRTHLRDLDSDATRWADTELDQHISRALSELNMSAPREASATVATTPGSTTLATSALPDFLDVETVELPHGAFPRRYVPFTVWAGTISLDLPAPPKGERAFVQYLARHTLDADGSTLSDELANLLGTGEAAEQFRRWGEGRLSAFRTNLRTHARAPSPPLTRAPRGGRERAQAGALGAVGGTLACVSDDPGTAPPVEPPERAAPSAWVYRGSIAALVLGSFLALFLVLRPPENESSAAPARPGATIEPTPTPAPPTPPPATATHAPTSTPVPVTPVPTEAPTDGTPEEPTPTAEPGATTFEHTVQEGETLFGIAVSYDLTLDEILEANPGIDQDVLQVGQIILVPYP